MWIILGPHPLDELLDHTSRVKLQHGGLKTCIIRCGKQLSAPCDTWLRGRVAYRLLRRATLCRDRMAHGCCTLWRAGEMVMDLKYRLLLAEKRFYPFRRWPRAQAQSVLFPGCGFAAQFPRTLEALEKLCAQHGVPVAHDCCGSPFGESGRVEDAVRFASSADVWRGLGRAK